MSSDTPSLPIPAPLRGNEPGTWAERSVKVRLPEIARRALGEHDWPGEFASRLASLADSVPSGQITPIQDPEAPDAGAWAGFVVPYVGMTWLEVPWFFAETYFYRRLLAETGFFRQGPTHMLDPFGPEKRRGLERGLNEANFPESTEGLDKLLLAALWGNRADLSLWPTTSAGSGDPQAQSGPVNRLLVDDRPAVIAHLERLPDAPYRIDIVLDNAGQELLADLALARGLLAAASGCRVVLHVKAHPTFVSDATRQDLDITLRQASASEGALAVLAKDLEEASRSGRLDVATDDFWTSPKAGWELPSGLREAFGQSDLVIFKGDANYRRMLGDRHWPYTTPFESVVSYFPAPMLCLRSLKADVAVGLTAEKMEGAAQADDDWMIDGRWAVIQYTPNAPDNL